MAEPMTVTIAYDGSECAKKAIDDIVYAGIPRNSIVHVYAVSEWFPSPMPEGAVDLVPETAYPDPEAGEKVARVGAAQLAVLRPDLTIESAGSGGSPAHRIIEYAEEIGSDLIVVGSHGRSALGRFFVGSVSHQVLTSAAVAVRVARGGYGERDEESPPLILAAVDGSEFTEKVLTHIERREWPSGTRVLVVTSAEYSYDPDEERAGLRRLRDIHRDALARLEGAGLYAESVIDTAKVNTTHTILFLAKEREVDMIVLGARGLTNFERFMMGSVSSTIALRAECSVEVVR